MDDKEAYQHLGRLLRYYRTRGRVTQQQLADLSTVSVRAIRDIETGCCQQPRRETVRLVADGLGLAGRERAEFEAAAGRAATSDELRRIYVSDPISPPAPIGALAGRQAELAMLVGSQILACAASGCFRSPGWPCPSKAAGTTSPAWPLLRRSNC